ncbi:hypothetical protein [Sphaerimonospora thailandensis]|uniref:Uncharacterized protein n=1 Tax=Sphaerimonospora thailandensis TaxID=795644 RepID=A0A8J3RA94_9ACTN|nr:hypothetical protein [Sphaerimonospora thailandensis]GIH72007.1 hypothetical protein Mth01_42600 [Sphaerimonospora thailandensis]
MPELAGAPRRTAAEILAIWPSATVTVDPSYYGGPLFMVLKEWEDSLPAEPSAPTADDLDDGFNEEDWYAYKYNERRIPLHLATDECHRRVGAGRDRRTLRRPRRRIRDRLLAWSFDGACHLLSERCVSETARACLVHAACLRP